MMSEESFGALLRRYRRAAGLSQEGLAERAGLTAQAISALERGVRRSPYRDTVRALCAALTLAPAERAALAASIDRRRGHPAVATLSPTPANGPRWPTSPAPPDPLLGRDAAVATLVGMLAAGEVRLLTLTGPGGVGKTRLGLAVAGALAANFADGSGCFVPLAPLREHGLVASAIAEALGLRESSGVGAIEAIGAHMGDRHQLLVLDNFEHVIAAAPVLTALLALCPRLTLLVTSRAPLHLRGERSYIVAPLALPDAAGLPTFDAIAHSPAVALFVRTARVAVPDFALSAANATAVVAICRRLDGLPLALELAAARVRTLAPSGLLARLAPALPLLTGGARDLPARHRALRATLAWSHDLLQPDERAVFRRLAVFAGGCTLEAVEAVCGVGEPPTIALLDGLGALLDQGLVQRIVPPEEVEGEPRFAMLETVREYGLECLTTSGETEATLERHAAYYLALAEEAEPFLTGEKQVLWLGRLTREHDNLRAALDWAVARGAGLLGVRLAGALWRFWYARGHHSEARRRLADVLALPTTASGPATAAARAKALHGAGGLAYTQGEYGPARALQEESLTLRRALGDRRGAAALVDNLGLLAREEGDYRRALGLHRESLALRRELGDRWGIAASLNNLGTVHGSLGDYASAAACYEESLATKRALGDRGADALTLMNLGEALQHLGDYARAVTLAEESLGLFEALGDAWGAAYALLNLGGAALDRGDPARAVAHLEACLALRRPLGARVDLAFALTNLGEAVRQTSDPVRARALHGEALALAEASGHRWVQALILVNLGALARDAEDLPGAGAHYAVSLTRFRALASAWGIAVALNGLAGVARATGEREQATTLYAEGLRQCRDIGDRLQAAHALEGLAGVAGERGAWSEATVLEGAAAALRKALGTPLAPRAWAARDDTLARARAGLGDVAFNAAWAEGGGLTLAELVARTEPPPQADPRPAHPVAPSP